MYGQFVRFRYALSLLRSADGASLGRSREIGSDPPENR
jgi:hypothetical protein